MLIELEHLTRQYSDAGHELRVIDDVSHSFPESGSIAILGKSGIGKSTLLHLIGGLDRPSSGAIRIGGTDISSLSDEALSSFRGRTIGFVFQFHHLLAEFSALENVAMPLIIQGREREDYEAQSKALLVSMGLGDRLHHRPGELSGGEQQRVAIARALVARPAVVLCDEPTGNLDHATAREVQDLLLSMQREQQNTLIVVTHNRELAQEMDFVMEMIPGGHLRPVS